MSSFSPHLLTGERYAVCGLGRNGAAVVQALLGMGAQVQAWDDRNADLPAHPNLTLAPLHNLSGMTALILSPGIPHLFPNPHPVADLARQQGIQILSDAEILYRAVRKSGSKAAFVAVTGTNGKSTTTALIAHLFTTAGRPCVAGGNLGTASLALPLLPDDGVYVIEMSSYMLERLDCFHASASCLLNLTPDHLDRHGSMGGYAAAKAHVFDNMGPQDLAVIGVDDSWCRSIASELRARGLKVIELNVDTLPSFDGPALPGRHNAQNVGAALAVAHHLGLDDNDIRTSLKSFPGLEHRLQKIAECNGVSFINDSKATNAEAASKALASYEKVMWIAGGVAKAGGIESLTPLFGHIAQAFLIGQDATELAITLETNNVPYTLCETLEKAVPAAFSAALHQGLPVVLLSPACASFDQFRSFEDRGSHFLRICDNIVKSAHSGATLTQMQEN
ncbi:UDP-N-acetylmuramoyl-L-alanine--D-glutamate ligase [Gluconobacter kanchanaburiensis]|uniref:UDP-N-acetylmuramoylalanine--D-glutamate ligase n=1 Tax=Gluconobacter kanchanaburiensis NBRC 103587 TaxID=1307948 RepID=A0A511BA40_9PROT|nr:UDP-N-acetylmuramoyl-L-alanine--D-glutamate ligase [Gluconobacter kanchanaburiensis]MBF0862968.1 UDP-N-acetylmuramoyl-L-alanine--D-glutamate ligase [Gluconobacter kanchanaburiensis]GBR70627.1 UDP-N-acetylmuramoyl-L-alanyl-D-glutamate synthetase [Gluconobacter kanchanaburiensis NBRC 103587]GEK97295.1 UDP-N-acetylmuramoylalanine--D-glutamate ligase [Gluconobacter kanchanaburiensis NBRC 103587]